VASGHIGPHRGAASGRLGPRLFAPADRLPAGIGLAIIVLDAHARVRVVEAKMSDPNQDGLDALSVRDCERHLRAGGVGILALVGSPAPILRPVNFALHGRWLLMRTGEGRILEAAQRAEPASFVVSEVDRFEHTGWSVVVSGKLATLEANVELARVPLRPWARVEKRHHVALSIDELSGRRLAGEGGVG
jgi:nitroimidazol reductase NimA-like FMN-containing flavoprotein (pyridoxamine 5'-phosphate oxidase superfamily)